MASSFNDQDTHTVSHSYKTKELFSTCLYKMFLRNIYIYSYFIKKFTQALKKFMQMPEISILYYEEIYLKEKNAPFFSPHFCLPPLIKKYILN